MNIKLKKVDVVIIVILVIIAGGVLLKAGYISFDDELDPEKIDDDIEIPPPPPPPTPPASFTGDYMRAVSPEDEGVHFDKLRISREWWYFSAVLCNEESELKNWTVAISFNHMARGDLLGTLKPDLLIVTLHGPNGEEYGGMINKERGLGIINPPTLEANSPGVSVTFDNSWAEGKAPEWHVHAEDEDIDKEHSIIIDLRFFSPSEPLWTIGERAFDKSKSNIASYMFTGCNVSGTVKIDGKEYSVKGLGHHEHSWSPNIVTKGAINGWDWSHITLDNGWNIYYTNYYPTPHVISSKTTNINPFGTIVITTDQGKTITVLDRIDAKITKSDDKIFALVKMPSDFRITAKPSIIQPLLKTYQIELDIEIEEENMYEKVWKFPTYVGMKVGMSAVSGKISWFDEDGDHEIEIDGISNTWSMRALL